MSRRRIATTLTAAAVSAVLATGAAWGDSSSAPGQQPPVNTVPPTISGTPQAGSTLTATPGAWNGKTLKYAYQWQRCDSSGANCGAVGGATGSTYTLSSADVGATMRVTVTASNQNGSATATSAATAVIATAPTAPPPSSSATPPSNTSAPTISGTAQQGQTLSASAGSWSGTTPMSYAYQWQRCNSSGASCAAISGATGSTYLLGSAEVGSTIRVSVTASNSAGSVAATSAATAVVSAVSGTVMYGASWETMNTSAGYAVPPGWGAQCTNNPAFTQPASETGSYALVTNTDTGSYAGRVDLPANTSSWTSCELLHNRTVGLNIDDYYAVAIMFPTNWQEPSSSFWGLVVTQLNYEGIWGFPVGLAAHSNYVNLVVQSGACVFAQGCQYSTGNGTVGPTNMPGPLYAIPAGQLTLGVWHELIVHVHWALDSTGAVEVWHRERGQSSWTQTVNLSGFPTLQTGTTFNGTVITSSNVANYADVDKFGAYRGPSSLQLSNYADNWCRATSFAAAAACVSP